MRRLIALALLGLAPLLASGQMAGGIMESQAHNASAITSGVLSPVNGGTGVANTATKTVTLGGPLVTSGAFTTTITSTATTNSTLPAGTHSLAPLDSPVFTSPTLGVAAATSIALGGGTALSTYIENPACTSGIAFGGAAVGVTYTTNVCRVTRIGNRAMVSISLILSAKGSSTGNVTLTGLPYTSNSTGSTLRPCSIVADGLTTTAGNMLMAGVLPSATVITIYTYAAGTLGNVSNTNVNATSQIYVSCDYEI